MKTEDIRAAAEEVKRWNKSVKEGSGFLTDTERGAELLADFVLSRCDVASDEQVAEMLHAVHFEPDSRLDALISRQSLLEILNRVWEAEAQIAALTEERDRLREALNSRPSPRGYWEY